MSVSGKMVPVQKGIQIAKSPQYAKHITDYMLEQSANKAQRLGVKVAGKTGTPERIWKSERINDGWYVFFAPKANGTGHIVTCIRLEAAKGSSEAVRLAGSYVVPILIKRGYIKSFEKSGGQSKPIKNRLAKNNLQSLNKQGSLTDDGQEIGETDTAQ